MFAHRVYEELLCDHCNDCNMTVHYSLLVGVIINKQYQQHPKKQLYTLSSAATTAAGSKLYVGPVFEMTIN